MINQLAEDNDTFIELLFDKNELAEGKIDLQEFKRPTAEAMRMYSVACQNRGVSESKDPRNPVHWMEEDLDCYRCVAMTTALTQYVPAG